MKKPRPIHRIGRKRRTLGWTLLTLGALVAAVWAASDWWWVMYGGGGWSAELERGYVVYSWQQCSSYYSPSGLHVDRQPSESMFMEPFCWWFGFEHGGYDGGFTQVRFGIGHVNRVIGVGNFLRLLLWPFPLLLCGAGIPLLRSGILARRRAMENKCKSCGYDLAGLAPDAICPECGKGGNAGAAAT